MDQQNPMDMFVSSVICQEFDRVAKHVRYSEERIEKMYKHPAQNELAQIHKKANRFGYIRKLAKGQQDKICPCCQLPINIESIELCYPTLPTKDFIKANKGQPYHLNAGTSLFFTFIKMAIIYLSFRFFITDGFNLITNFLGRNCDDPKNIQHCRTNFSAEFSSHNKNTDTDQTYVFIVDILNFITVLLSILFFTLYRRYQLKIFRLAGLSNHSQADYTIFVEQIPILFLKQQRDNNVRLADCDYKTRLKQLFQNQIDKWLDGIQKKNTEHYEKDRILNQLQSAMYEVQKEFPGFRKIHSLKVKSITLCHDLTQLEKLNNLRQELMQKHKDDRQKGNRDDKSQEYIKNQINALNDQIIQLSIKFAKQSTPQFNTSHFLGKAFISFQYQHYRQYFLEYLKEDISFHNLDKKLKISPAAQPSDVYWYNMKVPQNERTKSVLYSYLIMTILLFLSFGLLLVLQYYKMKISDSSSTIQEQKTTAEIVKGYVLTVVMTVATIGINFGLEIAINKLTEFERHKTKTDEIISLIVKTVVAQFLNTAIIYYIISLMDIVLSKDIKSSFGDNGLVVNITSLIVVSGAIQIVTNLFQFGEIYKKIRNHYKYSKEKTVNLFQIELNKELQPTEFSFAMRYAYYILNVYVVSFYSYIVPYTSLILIVIFIAQYWVDKYNLFKRFSCPTNFNYRLSIFTLKIFECSIFFFALGNLLFAPTIHTNSRGSDYRIINIISLILAFAYCLAIFIVPKTWLQTFTSIEIDRVSYKQCTDKKPFNKTYQLQNPVSTFANVPEQKNLKQSKHVQFNRYSKFAEASDLKMIRQYSLRESAYTSAILDKNQSASKEQIPAMKDSQFALKEKP